MTGELHLIFYDRTVLFHGRRRGVAGVFGGGRAGDGVAGVPGGAAAAGDVVGAFTAVPGGTGCVNRAGRRVSGMASYDGTLFFKRLPHGKQWPAEYRTLDGREFTALPDFLGKAD